MRSTCQRRKDLPLTDRERAINKLKAKDVTCITDAFDDINGRFCSRIAHALVILCTTSRTAKDIVETLRDPALFTIKVPKGIRAVTKAVDNMFTKHAEPYRTTAEAMLILCQAPRTPKDIAEYLRDALAEDQKMFGV